MPGRSESLPPSRAEITACVRCCQARGCFPDSIQKESRCILVPLAEGSFSKCLLQVSVCYLSEAGQTRVSAGHLGDLSRVCLLFPRPSLDAERSLPGSQVRTLVPWEPPSLLTGGGLLALDLAAVPKCQHAVIGRLWRGKAKMGLLTGRVAQFRGTLSAHREAGRGR